MGLSMSKVGLRTETADGGLPSVEFWIEEGFALCRPDRKPDMARHEVKVLIAVKKVTPVAQGDSGNEVIRRWDWQTLSSNCMSNPVG